MVINTEGGVSAIGGKAYQLQRLSKFACVPPFFVITFEQVSEIQEPANLVAIREASRNVGPGPFAVRSSASVEDATDASFAGMFETVLGVGTDNLAEAIEKVLASLNSSRANSYKRARGLEGANASMAVIVQRLVCSRVSGVCFSRVGSHNTLVIEACLGLGEALVSGRVTPDHYVLERASLKVLDERVGYQREAVECVEGRSEYVRLPYFRRNGQKLTRTELREVATAALDIENQLGFDSADIEWAYERDSLYILQARRFVGNSVI